MEIVLIVLVILVIIATWDLYRIIKKRGGLLADDQPDSEQIFIDAKGNQWFKYDIHYFDQDRDMSFCLWAMSFEDANRRLKLITQSARVEGQIFSQVRKIN